MGKVIFRSLAALATATTERIPVGGQAVIQGVLMLPVVLPVPESVVAAVT